MGGMTVAQYRLLNDNQKYGCSVCEFCGEVVGYINVFEAELGHGCDEQQKAWTNASKWVEVDVDSEEFLAAEKARKEATMNKVTVTVSGLAGVGKSAIAQLISETLVRHGFDASLHFINDGHPPRDSDRQQAALARIKKTVYVEVIDSKPSEV